MVKKTNSASPLHCLDYHGNDTRDEQIAELEIIAKDVLVCWSLLFVGHLSFLFPMPTDITSGGISNQSQIVNLLLETQPVVSIITFSFLARI